MVFKGDSLGDGDVLGLWDGNPIKLDCDDHCTTTNVINSLSNEKKEAAIFFFFSVYSQSEYYRLCEPGNKIKDTIHVGTHITKEKTNVHNFCN